MDTPSLPEITPPSTDSNRKFILILTGLGIMLTACVCMVIVAAVGIYQMGATTMQATAEAEETETARSNARATAVAASAQATAEAKLNWPVVFDDNFVNADDWCEGEDSGRFADTNLYVSGGKYRWFAQAKDGVIWWCTPEAGMVSDFSVTVDARQVSGTVNSDFGLVLRMDANGNYYYFGVSETSTVSDQGSFSFQVRYKEKWETILDWTPTTAVRLGDTNQLQALVEGEHFELYINGELVGTAESDRVQTGEAGVAIELYDKGDVAAFEFDNFELRSPETLKKP